MSLLKLDTEDDKPMAEDSNSRIVITATTKEIADTIYERIKEALPDQIVYATDVRGNTRPPHLNGVHQMLYLVIGAVDIE